MAERRVQSCCPQKSFAQASALKKKCREVDGWWYGTALEVSHDCRSYGTPVRGCRVDAHAGDDLHPENLTGSETGKATGNEISDDRKTREAGDFAS